MDSTQGKFLVNLISSLGHRQIFFLVWGSIAVAFVLLMFKHQRSRTIRNFKDGSTKPGQNPQGSKAIVLKDKQTGIQRKD